MTCKPTERWNDHYSASFFSQRRYLMQRVCVWMYFLNTDGLKSSKKSDIINVLLKQALGVNPIIMVSPVNVHSYIPYSTQHRFMITKLHLFVIFCVNLFIYLFFLLHFVCCAAELTTGTWYVQIIQNTNMNYKGIWYMILSFFLLPQRAPRWTPQRTESL